MHAPVDGLKFKYQSALIQKQTATSTDENISIKYPLFRLAIPPLIKVTEDSKHLKQFKIADQIALVYHHIEAVYKI